MSAIETFTININDRKSFANAIDKANQRLARNGLDERFTAEYSQPRNTVVEIPETPFRDGGRFDVTVIDVAVTWPVLTKNGWEVVATITSTLDGEPMVWEFEPGVRQAIDTTDNLMRCDHCGSNRRRRRTVVLRHDEDYSIVGHNCVDLYTSFCPDGLWKLQDSLLNIEDRRTVTRADTPRGIAVYSVREIIAVAYKHSDHGRNYVGRSRFGEASTADITREILTIGSRQNEVEQALRELSDAQYDEILQAVASSDDTSSYRINLAKLLQEEYVQARWLGMVASAIWVWVRHAQHVGASGAAPKTAADEPAANKEAQWVGTVGGTVENIDVTVTSHRTFTSYYSYKGEQNHVLTMTDAEGDQYVWISSSDNADRELGAKLTIVKATVKAHKTYRKVKQNQLKRVNLAERAESSSDAVTEVA